MKNQILNRKEKIVFPITLLDVLDSQDKCQDSRWFKNLVKHFSQSDDLSLETFERIESKRIIRQLRNID